MRIDDINRLPPTQDPTRVKQDRAQPSEPQQAGLPLDISHVSQLAQAACKTDPARLEGLRAAVSEGTYSVSSPDLANSIIDSHLQD